MGFSGAKIETGMLYRLTNQIRLKLMINYLKNSNWTIVTYNTPKIDFGNLTLNVGE
jgi:hypothetical protein